MKITQGAFSYLPDLTDEEIQLQLEYCLKNDWAVSVEYTDDPHPRNVYWEMWEQPLFDLKDAAPALQQVRACREAYPNGYIRVNGYDRRYLKQTTALSFIVHRPKQEPGFRLAREEGPDRQIRYTMHAYSTDHAAGARYLRNGANGNGHGNGTP